MRNHTEPIYAGWHGPADGRAETAAAVVLWRFGWGSENDTKDGYNY